MPDTEVDELWQRVGGKVGTLAKQDQVINDSVFSFAELTFEEYETLKERYRAEMSKHYYQPDQYDTYLDHLGISFPTFARSET
jgi:uncharacterized protein YfkK (UPF0435 family)